MQTPLGMLAGGSSRNGVLGKDLSGQGLHQLVGCLGGRAADGPGLVLIIEPQGPLQLGVLVGAAGNQGQSAIGGIAFAGFQQLFAAGLTNELLADQAQVLQISEGKAQGHPAMLCCLLPQEWPGSPRANQSVAQFPGFYGPQQYARSVGPQQRLTGLLEYTTQGIGLELDAQLPAFSGAVPPL